MIEMFPGTVAEPSVHKDDLQVTVISNTMLDFIVNVLPESQTISTNLNLDGSPISKVVEETLCSYLRVIMVERYHDEYRIFVRRMFEILPHMGFYLSFL